MATLGTFLKAARKDKRIGLRDFCEMTGLDSTYYTRIELGETSPLEGEDFLQKISTALEIESGTKEYSELETLIRDSEGIIVEPNSRSLLQMLPAFFRNPNGGKPTKEDLLKVVKLLKDC